MKKRRLRILLISSFITIFVIINYITFFTKTPSQLLGFMISKRSLSSENLPPPVNFIEYSIQRGDTLWDIAYAYGINIDTIVSFNNIEKVHNISLNKKILIPTVDGIMYTPKSGESIADILATHNVSLRKIAAYNSLSSKLKTNYVFKEGTNSLLYGGRLFLPGVSYSLAERAGKLGLDFLKPLTAFRITSIYGFRIHPITKKRSFHKGIDLAAPTGTTVYSAKGGTVTFAGESAGYGKLIIIRHPKSDNKPTYETRYAHLSAFLVSSGTRVMSQQPIGKVGNTGTSSGPHLHFEIHKNGSLINPRDVTDLR